MTKSLQDFEMVAGDAKTLRFTITNSDGMARDVSSSDLYWSLAKDARDAALIEKVNPVQITVEGAGDNVVLVALEPDDTRSLKGLYYHELKEVEGNTIPTTLAKGTGLIRPGLIQPT